MFKKMNNSQSESIKEKKVNDNDWSCLVVFLVESNPLSMDGIDLFEKFALSSDRTDIHNLTPEDLEADYPKEMAIIKEAPRVDTNNGQFVDSNNPSKLSQSWLQAFLIKKYILEYKVNDLKKRATKIRYLITNEIVLPQVDSSVPELDYGAFCYFVLTRFYDPFLVNELIGIGVPVVAVFELRIEAEFNRTKSINSQSHEERHNSIYNFWDEFERQLENQDNEHYFTEFLFLPIEINSTQWNGKKREDIIYEHVLLSLLSLNSLMRKYIHYISNIEIIDAPTIFEKINMNLYNKLMDSFPLECVTIELILHCIVEQVVAQFESIYNKPFIEKIECVTEKKLIKFPLLYINHRDKIRRMTFNLKTENQLDLSIISFSMHSLMTYATVWKYYPSQEEVEKALKANQIKKLLTCTTQIIAEDKFLKLLHLISLNKLLRLSSHLYSMNINRNIYEHQLLNFKSILDKKGNGKMAKVDNVIGEIHSNILSKRSIQINSLKNFLECSEFDSLTSYEFHNYLHDFCYTEDLRKETLLHVLNKAYSNFLYNDYYYCPLTDKVILRFHNFHDENGLNSRVQEGLFNSKIGFGDFWTYPDNETEIWLSNQEKNIKSVDDALRKSYISRNFPEINPLNFVLNPSVKVNIPFPKKEYITKQSKKVPLSKAYDSFGTSRIKVSEQTDMFYSIDGSSLTLRKTKWLRKDGYITLILKSHKHLITLHQSLLDFYKPLISDSNQDIVFNIQSNKGIIVSTRININKVNASLFGLGKKNAANYETLITLPNGLLIELFRGKYNFIKQRFLDKKHLEDDNLSKEDYRIFLNNGTVMVFMNDGSVVIMYCNSTEARIKIIGKKAPKHRYTEVYESQETVQESNILEEDEEMEFEIIRHEVTGWDGKFLRFNRGELILSKQFYGLRAAFCTTRGLFTARSDGTKCHIDPDGILTISFLDKTITTVIPIIETVILDDVSTKAPQKVELEDNNNEESIEMVNSKYIMDHPYYMKVEFFSEQWIVHLPFGGQLTASTKEFELIFDKLTNINYNNQLLTVITKNRINNNKSTLTNIFLKGEMTFEYTICSVQSSDGKVFHASNTGETSLTTVQAIASEKKEGVETLQDETLIKKKTKIKSSEFERKLSLSQLPSPHKRNKISNAIRHFKNQILLYSKTDIQIKKTSNLKNPTQKPTNKFSNSKERHQFFILNRDLSGCELMNQNDIKMKLKKYKTNFKVFQPFLPCVTVTNNITVCQMPLTKTWQQLFLTECCSSRLYNTNLKRNELLDIPEGQKWLCNPKIDRASQTKNFSYENKQIIDNIALKHPAMLIRRIKNITTKFNVFKMFKEAIKQFNDINCEILYKYITQFPPVKKLQSDINKSEMIFKNAMDRIMQPQIKISSIGDLTKGESMSKTVSSASSIKLDESKDSEETESKINTDSVS